MLTHIFKPWIQMDQHGICINQHAFSSSGSFTTDCLYLADKKLMKKLCKQLKSSDPETILKHLLKNR